MAKELRKRNEVPEEFTWNLKDLYETVEAWEEDLKQLDEMCQQIVSYKGKICASAQNLLAVSNLQSEFGQKINRAFSYTSRLFDQDTTNGENQALHQKLRGLAAKWGSQQAFVEPEFLEMSEETLEEFMKQEPALELYRKHFAEMFRTKEHTLSAEMETLMSMTSEMGATASNTYSMLNNADLKFPEMEDENGETIRITTGRYISLLESTDRRVRKEVFEKYYSVYEQFSHTMASLYDGQIKRLIFNAKARKYPTTLDAAVDGTNVPSKVYHNLLEAVSDNVDKMHRYVRLRKKALGVDELHMYDMYTPIVGDETKTVTFEEAKETVLKALAPMGEDYVAKVKEGFENRWIDVYENEGKRSGAYSAGAFGVHPYVLLNHNDNLSSMFTLAHEMGHAMHSYYSNTTQPYVYSHYVIFVAEVASICNEMLLMDYLLKNTTDKKERAYLLNHFCEKFRGTMYRQTMFAEYELKTNQMVESGVSLTAENLTKLYSELNAKYYGPDVVTDREIGFEWARIPHFYYNFYVYQYATGFAAAVALSQQILKEGAPAVERYKKFLSGGCSETPIDLLKIAGVDMEDPKPIHEALKVFDGILAEMEELL